MAEVVEATLNGKYKIILPKHRADRPEWYTEKGWERARLDYLHDTIKRLVKNRDGRLCKTYYIGAEEGEMAALCQMWGSNVLLFEPNERVLPNIKAIWEANDLNIPEVMIGFAGREATAKPEWGKGQQTWDKITGDVIGDHGFKELHNPADVPIYKIDDFNTAGYISPDIITMDVEGAEWEVLQGVEKTIDTFKPVIVLSLHPEFLFRIYDKYSYEVRRWIIDKGYKEILLDYQHEAHFAYEPINE